MLAGVRPAHYSNARRRPPGAARPAGSARGGLLGSGDDGPLLASFCRGGVWRGRGWPRRSSRAQLRPAVLTSPGKQALASAGRGVCSMLVAYTTLAA